MENTHRTFAKKTLAVVVTGFLATGLVLTTAQAAHATTRTLRAVTLTCPSGLSLVEVKTGYDDVIDLGARKLAKFKVTYTCSNSDGSITAEPI